MYLAVGTRPDIAFAVSTVSQALDKPTEADWQKVKHILRYLKGTSHMGIVYQAGHQAGVLTPVMQTMLVTSVLAGPPLELFVNTWVDLCRG